MDIEALRASYFGKSERWNPWCPTWGRYAPTRAELPDTPSRYRRISLCTTCMNRAHDLKTTLPQNIQANCDYPNLEFVVLNYNSTDDLDSWMRNQMMRHIDSGIINYYHTIEPAFYESGHSKNIAVQVARGDVVTNVDADNYTGVGFASTLNRLAELQAERAVFAPLKSLQGRLGFYKREFMELGGYDESLVGYGFDDFNLLHRALCSGYRLLCWDELGEYSTRIETPRNDVTANMSQKDYRETQELNRVETFNDLAKGQYIANVGRTWGAARLSRNFAEEIRI
jgi:hypothetical protein